MATDQDRFFIGGMSASTPRGLLGQGVASRTLNASFNEGSISNGIDFKEVEWEFGQENNPYYATTTTPMDLLTKGDVQLVAPHVDKTGEYLIIVISSRIFSLNINNCRVCDITEKGLCLPKRSCDNQLSTLEGDGGVSGSGGVLTIFNWPNQSIFISPQGVRSADSSRPLYEMPPARMGVTAATRSFIIQANNSMRASDPYGGANGFAPLTFEETWTAGLHPRQNFSIGSPLDSPEVTALCRLPGNGGNQPFLSTSIIAFTKYHRYVAAVSNPRDTWGVESPFINYAGAGNGAAGPWSCTLARDNLYIMDTKGRIRQLFREGEAGSIVESFSDDPLGQYLCECEAYFHHRRWYEDLDHSRSSIHFFDPRMYATVHPFDSPAITLDGSETFTKSHRALAVGSMDPLTQVGQQARLTWESFYDYMQPVGMAQVGDRFFVVSKDCYGRIKIFEENRQSWTAETTTIYTRGYFGSSTVNAKSLTMSSGSLFFRRMFGQIKVSISHLVDGEWICITEKLMSPKQKTYTFNSKTKCSTGETHIPLKITIDHKGCMFELTGIMIEGEIHLERAK